MRWLREFDEHMEINCDICGKKGEYHVLNGKKLSLCKPHLLKEERKLKLDKINENRLD